ncbi:NADPH-dependent FMN reductase [Microbacterium rhizophilus]|uniref:NADPH-dependent FMN reductase n=1 Tax=Microbacterium rhizophilus TaxID=3138934 RepID=UPI0031ED0F93
MPTIAIITGSTGPNRQSRAVAEWAHAIASSRSDAEYALIDIAEQGLPLLDEPLPPSFGTYANEHTKAWSAVISPFDGYLFVTPEYNHAAPPALTNAIDYLFHEWADKAAGFVSYGSTGGVRAVENLRLIAAELSMATVRTSPGLTLADDFKDYVEFSPRPFFEPLVNDTLDELVSWATALKRVREAAS